MTTVEKIFSVFAVIFAFALLTSLIIFPEIRQLNILLPLSLAGMLINIGLMFVVLRDIFYRDFKNPAGKYIWIAVILIFWPTVLYYLPKYGFKPR